MNSSLVDILVVAVAAEVPIAVLLCVAVLNAGVRVVLLVDVC